MNRRTRAEILESLREKERNRALILGTGAGTGLSAVAEEKGGADLIIAYATGRYRMAGRSSMTGRFAFGDANAETVRMAAELRPLVRHAPLIAGVFAQDPFRDMDAFLDELTALGYEGVQNIPGMGGQEIMEGAGCAAALEAVGYGFAREAELVRKAHRRGLLTTPYCSRPDHLKLLVEAGADVLVLQMGLTGRESDHSMVITPLERCAERINALSQLAKELDPHVIVLCHGGPIVSTVEMRYLMQRCPRLAGFYGASTIERIPVEQALMQSVRAFGALTLSSKRRV